MLIIKKKSKTYFFNILFIYIGYTSFSTKSFLISFQKKIFKDNYE
jgi:hypothetical protein